MNLEDLFMKIHKVLEKTDRPQHPRNTGNCDMKLLSSGWLGGGVGWLAGWLAGLACWLAGLLGGLGTEGLGDFLLFLLPPIPFADGTTSLQQELFCFCPIVLPHPPSLAVPETITLSKY